MRVAITGSSGLIGTALCSSLAEAGHDVLRLVRRPARAADEISWDPGAGRLDPASLAGVEAVVNLAGANVGGRRWTSAYKRELRESRIAATQTLVAALAVGETRPRVLVSMSASGIYGLDHGSDVIDEDEPHGEGFLADICRDCEAAASAAAEADIAVCHPRPHMVIARQGGALQRMLPWFRRGLGGPLAGGRQYWSPVSRDDVVRALLFLAETHGCSGPYNIAAPEPVTNAEFSRVLAHALSRPALLPVPKIALRIRYGDYADDILSSVRLSCARLVDSGFEFHHPDAPSIITAALN